MDHDYAINFDTDRVQLPTFYPDASHYIYHQPSSFIENYGNGVAEIREMQHSGMTPPEILRGLGDNSSTSNQALHQEPILNRNRRKATTQQESNRKSKSTQQTVTAAQTQQVMAENDVDVQNEKTRANYLLNGFVVLAAILILWYVFAQI